MRMMVVVTVTDDVFFVSVFLSPERIEEIRREREKKKKVCTKKPNKTYFKPQRRG